MAWIELHQTIWTHRKTLLLAAELGIPEIYAAAHMIHLWCWALDNAPKGDLSGLPARIISFGAGWSGDPEAFVSAAVRAGFLDATDDGGLKIHDWDDYAGRLMEIQARKRETARERQRRFRERRKQQEPKPAHPGNAFVTRESRVSNALVTHRPDRTIPDRTIKIKVDPSSVRLPYKDTGTYSTQHLPKEENARAHAPSPDFSRLEEELNRKLTPLETASLQEATEGMAPELLAEAVRRARQRGRLRIPYVLRILRDWQAAGCRTPEDAARFENETSPAPREPTAAPPARADPDGYDQFIKE
jgi:DnaD/phage-associated family protein